MWGHPHVHAHAHAHVHVHVHVQVVDCFFEPTGNVIVWPKKRRAAWPPYGLDDIWWPRPRPARVRSRHTVAPSQCDLRVGAEAENLEGL